MFLERFVNWMLGLILTRFKPKISFVKKYPAVPGPTQRPDGSLSYDLYTPVNVKLVPGERRIIDTGIMFELPPYVGLFISDKSSSASERHLSVCGGIVDPSARCTLNVLLVNVHPTQSIELPKGTAIAQAIFHLPLLPALSQVEESQLSEILGEDKASADDWEWHQNSYNLRKRDL